VNEFNGTTPNGEFDFIASNGEMARLIRLKDWSATPLGPIQSWPQSLRTAVSLCLASNFPIDIIWGPEHTQIYNDGYKVACGEGHPAFLGMNYSVSWASAWPAIGKPFQDALAGETSYLENQRMFLHRNGYLEETFFTFSLSPIRDETGGIGGLFHPVTETTSTMLAQRRTRAVRDLTARLGEAKTTDAVYTLTSEILETLEFDLPFVLLYRATNDDGAGLSYGLAAHIGLSPGTALTPAVLAGDITAPWPLARLSQTGATEIISGLRQLFGSMKCGPYEEPPDTAIALTIRLPGSERPAAVMIAGASSRLPFDDLYRAYYDLVAAAIAAALARARTFEEERQRVEALAAIDKAKTAFFSNVSHEFRTPLTLILGPLEEALADAGASVAQRERLHMVRRNALRLLKLVNALLDFSRVEASRTQARFEPVDLANFTRELASNFDSACERAGLKLILDCTPLGQPAYVDRDMWEKIVLNLVSNAFKFTLCGSITVALRPMDGRINLLVRDTGVGIPADGLPHVFERFYRIEGQRGRTHEGSGIGLALVDELVKLHGGTIQVSSVVGQGTDFAVFIPFGTAHLPSEYIYGDGLASTAVGPAAFVEEALRWIPDAEDWTVPGDARRPDIVNPLKEAASPPENVPRIVLADDNADMRAYVARILRQEGYVVDAVPDGEAALAVVRQGPLPDLVLTDVMMPVLDGFGLLARLREDPAMEGLLVILLSARAGEEARVEGLAAGADDYLVKPFSARELCARVAAAIALARQRRDAALRERDLHAALAKQESERLLRTIVDAAPGLIYAKDRQGRMLLANLSVMDLINKPWSAVMGRTDDDFLDDKVQAAMVMANDRRIMETGQTDEMEELVGTDDGHVRVWLSKKTPLRDGNTDIVGLVGVSVEITERKRDENRLRLLVHELNHRVKNTLAVVQATAAQTLRGIDAGVRHMFEGRLQALSAAHDVLTHEFWVGADLNDIVTKVLAPHDDPERQRFRIFGPRLRLLPRAAVALSMGLHELATNALKYGALSQDDGAVEITWQVTGGRFYLTWMERGGPLVVEPVRRGFGTRLIERSLAQDLGGPTRLSFAPDGVVCVFEAPVVEIVAAEQAEPILDVGIPEDHRT
jgi:PAS domain S-box-containing protein